MTVFEALHQSVDILGRISVPVSLIQQIGMPIQQAVGLIRASVDALEKDAQKQNQEQQEQEQPEEEPAGEE